MHDVQTILPVGSVIRERYLVEDLLGRGGFGAVYLVKDQRVKGNLFALKEITDSNKAERERFAFEGEVLKRLDHPALPRVYRVFEDDTNNRAYMLMDYIEGPNLETLRLLQPEKRFTLSQVIKIMTPIIGAVEYLHKQRPPIIHRDIKPANIIAPSADAGAVLVDFGIAKEYEQDSTTTAIRRCSPGYGAPEQYARGTNTQTDIYGLAATCYALLTGDVPADALYRMTQLGSKGNDPLERANELVPTIPVAVADVIQRAMAIDSNARFATVNEFWQALTAHAKAEEVALAAPVVTYTQQSAVKSAAAIEAIPTRIPIPATRREPGRKRRRGAIALLLLALALVAFALGTLFSTGILSGLQHTGQSAVTPTSGNTHNVGATRSPTVTHSSPTSVPTTAPTTKPTAAPTAKPVTPPPSNTGLPLLGSQYQGTISDQVTTPPTTDAMTLTQLRQSGTNISGYFYLGGNLQGSGPFTGTINAQRAIVFNVPAAFGHLPLHFTGTVNANGSMSGNYCSYDANGCNNAAGGYGTWNVTPSSPTSISNLPVGSVAVTNDDQGNGTGDGKDHGQGNGKGNSNGKKSGK